MKLALRCSNMLDVVLVDPKLQLHNRSLSSACYVVVCVIGNVFSCIGDDVVLLSSESKDKAWVHAPIH